VHTWISTVEDIAGDALLVEWRVMQTCVGTRHFVGKCMRNGGCCRVSPPIISFDGTARVGLTKGGLRFALSGVAGRDKGLVKLCWYIAAWSNKVSGHKDVTGEYLSELLTRECLA
jgi:hypothetical protein